MPVPYALRSREVPPPQVEAVIDLDAFGANLAALAACAPSSELMTVVKANAYGHGAVPMARAARAAGSWWRGVAPIGEALARRAGGDTGPLGCWLAPPGADVA
ncbi:MAG: alanine racemase, partial [Aeromicrobium sp.]